MRIRPCERTATSCTIPYPCRGPARRTASTNSSAGFSGGVLGSSMLIMSIVAETRGVGQTGSLMKVVCAALAGAVLSFAAAAAAEEAGAAAETKWRVGAELDLLPFALSLAAGEAGGAVNV